MKWAQFNPNNKWCKTSGRIMGNQTLCYRSWLVLQWQTTKPSLATGHTKPHTLWSSLSDRTYCPKHYEVVKTWSLRSSNVEKLLQASHLKQLNRYSQNKVIKDLRAWVTSFKKGNSKLIVCWPVEFGGPLPLTSNEAWKKIGWLIWLFYSNKMLT